MSLQPKVSFPVVKRLPKQKARRSKCNSENDFDIENCPSEKLPIKRNLFSVRPAPKKSKLHDERDHQPSHDISPAKSNISLCKRDTNVLRTAKYAFHTSSPSRLVGRIKEMAEISRFVRRHLEQKQPGSLYISGAPGTGKTSSLMHVLNDVNAEFCTVFINCMTVSNSTMVYKTIAEEIGMPKSAINSKSIYQALEKYIVTSKVMTLLVLDEIDQLDSKDQEVLYSLFQWPQLPNSTVILIGIANALDLTDRILPRLHAFNFKPQLMHFQPYSKDQIVAILEDRLAEINSEEPVIKPIAIQLCARKVAASTGDIRKALDVCRRSIEITEKQTKEQLILKVSSDDRCNPGSPAKRTSPIKPVDCSQINAVLHEVYGSRVQACAGLNKKSETVTLPLQQTMILCTLIVIKKNAKVQDFNLGKLYDVYRKICHKKHIMEINETEFYSLCQLVQSRGFIELKRNKIARLTKVCLTIEENEIEHLFQDRTLLASILADPSVVNRK